jgi:hypothetical protein
MKELTLLERIFIIKHNKEIGLRILKSTPVSVSIEKIKDFSIDKIDNLKGKNIMVVVCLGHNIQDNSLVFGGLTLGLPGGKVLESQKWLWCV